MGTLFRATLAAALLLVSQFASAQQAMGKLVFDIKPFTSEIVLKKKIEAQLQSGGIEWGVKDGQLVVAVLNKRFIAFDITHMTRYGQSETLDLPVGEYKVTCVGFEPHTAFSVEKMLAKGGYVNENVLTFTIEDGKTTTLSMNPIIKKSTTFVVEFYMPELMTTVATDAGTTDAKSINVRDASSIDWPAYNGPLKFVAPK
jgi:hypothetical protein